MRARRVAVLGVLGVGVVAAAVACASRPTCQRFDDGLVPGATRQVCGPILARYLADGGPSVHGLPVTDETVRPAGTATPALRQVGFTRSTIFYDPATGETSVGFWERSTGP